MGKINGDLQKKRENSRNNDFRKTSMYFFFVTQREIIIEIHYFHKIRIILVITLSYL